jgi:hypothetical protein
MKFIYNDLMIEIIPDEQYSLNSSDNNHTYDHVYYDCASEYITKYGVFVKHDERILHSCLLSSSGGPTSPHERSVLIEGNNIIVILGDSIFCLYIPYLELIWKTSCEDTVSCFEVYKCRDGYIVHGEVSIFMISKSGQKLWEFFGRDIFTTADGNDDF